MKLLAPLAVIISLSGPVSAKDDTLDEMLKQFEELSEQAQTMMEGWMKEMGPTLEGLADKIGDLSAYHPPEILENGDIIIRRKAPLPETNDPKELSPDTKGKDTIDL